MSRGRLLGLSQWFCAQLALDWRASESLATQRIRPQDFKPGMTATADVITRQRSILHYLAKPLTRAFSSALMQR